MWPKVGLDVAELEAELFVVLDTGLLGLITRMFCYLIGCLFVCFSYRILVELSLEKEREGIDMQLNLIKLTKMKSYSMKLAFYLITKVFNKKEVKLELSPVKKRLKGMGNGQHL